MTQQSQVKFEDIQDHRFKTQTLVSDYLRRFGWKNTSGPPGCLWLWERTMSDGRTVLANTDLALAITIRALDEGDASEDDELGDR